MTNCPNCGAPIEHYYNYQCPYCKTFLKNTDETVNRASNKEFIIDRVIVEPSRLASGYDVIMYGHIAPIFQYFVETTSAELVDIQEFTSKKGWSVFIPYKWVLEAERKGNYEDLITYIANRVPPELRTAENSRKIWKVLEEERVIYA